MRGGDIAAPRPGRRRTTALAAVTAAALAVGAGPAAGQAGSPLKITAKRAGGVQLGATFRSLRSQGLVGSLQPGCELAGPNQRSARLRAPLKGSVNFTTGSPRRVRDIALTGGGAARGVEVGDRFRAVKRAFPKVKLDKSTAQVFGIFVARVPKGAGGRMEFAIDAQSRRVTTIAVPGLAFCE
jgi:hypothetical protein